MFVKPKISKQKAEEIFAAKKSQSRLVPKIFPKKNRIRPERLEIVYLPFYLFDVSVEKKIKGKSGGDALTQNVTLSVDGLLGHAVLYAEDSLDVEKDLETPVPTCDFEISSDEAAKMALDQYKGILLEHGLRTRSHPSAGEISEGREVFYPFWVAYLKMRKGYDFKAMDAVAGEIQGVRMRRLFMNALRKLG
jgi:hypothetical protein